jgi:hypothetical protein
MSRSKAKKKPAALTIQEQEVLFELKAFAAGGQCSLEVLQRVWPNILREYKVESMQIDRLLFKAGLFMRMGKIKSFRCQDDDHDPQ